LTEEAEAKRLTNESARREEATIRKEIEEKELEEATIRKEIEEKELEEARIRKEIEEMELEEARALLAEAEKRKGKKGKKAIGDGVSSFCSWLSF